MGYRDLNNRAKLTMICGRGAPCSNADFIAGIKSSIGDLASGAI